MSFIEKVFENQLNEALADVIEHAKKRLTKTEQAQLLFLLAEKLNVKPKHMTEATLSWQTYQSSPTTANCPTCGAKPGESHSCLDYKITSEVDETG